MQYIIKGMRMSEKYTPKEYNTALSFSQELKKEMKDFIKAVVLFGSKARASEEQSTGDIDILIIINDLTLSLKQDMLSTYNIIANRIAKKLAKNMHLTTMKLTDFWDYLRKGDPILFNMLRDGVPVYDAGFFEPSQVLLQQGRILPSKESMWSYTMRAPAAVQSAEQHITQAALDLHWAVVDAAHAAIMTLGEVPPSPEHIPDMLRKRLVPLGLETRYIDTFEHFTKLRSLIEKKQLPQMSGAEYEKYYQHADAFVQRMKQFIELKKA